MTFKMLIVDDEPIICRGLQLTVPWMDYQIEVVGLASDGAEAIEKIKTHPGIDIVLTDVRMPNVDGLELASFISKNHPHIRTVIISGYDDFKYAQQALQLGVQDYLLKPVDIDQLLGLVKKITGEIQKVRNEMQQIHRVKMKNAIFHQIIDSTGSKKRESEEVEGLHVYPFITMVSEYSKLTKQMSPESVENWKADWESMIETILQRNGLTSLSLFTGDNKLLTCIMDPKRILSPKEVFSLFADLSEIRKFSLLFVLNNTETPVNSLAGIYQAMSKDSQYLPLSPKRFIISPVSGSDRQEPLSYPVIIESELIQAIFQLKQEEVTEKIECLFTYLEERRFFLDVAAQVCREILTKVVHQYTTLFRKEPVQTDLYFTREVDVNLALSYRLVREMFEQDINKIASQLDVKQTNSKDWLMERAEEYIKQYYKEQIKAHEVADVINITPNYFSTLFKQKTGKSFNEYVNQLRVEAAKQLLEETPFNVNEIAEKVGYREYKYFVDVFKKLTGYTPTFYRKLTANPKNSF